MATWLELSICKLVFCILPLANISFSPPPLTRFSVSLSLKHYYSSSYFVQSWHLQHPLSYYFGKLLKFPIFWNNPRPQNICFVKWQSYVVSNFTTTSPGVFASHEFSVKPPPHSVSQPLHEILALYCADIYLCLRFSLFSQ